jgi:hypothetical protein
MSAPRVQPRVNSNADPVPSTKSKCNAPSVPQASVAVAVLPAITRTDGLLLITPGEPTTYSVVITNTTGVALDTGSGNAAVFRDPAVAGLTASAVSCSASGGATCPASSTVAAMQSAGGITIPAMPTGSSVTFSVTASVNGGVAAGATITNVATVTTNGFTNTASDSNSVVYPSLTHRKTVALLSDPVNGASNPKSISGATEEYTLRVSNSGLGTLDTDTVAISDPIPANTSLLFGDLGGVGSGPVAFTQGSPSSALTWSFVSLASLTDDLEFSNDGGATFSYVPSGSVDPNVTDLRFNPKGRRAADSGAGTPYFELRFRVRVD